MLTNSVIFYIFRLANKYILELSMNTIDEDYLKQLDEFLSRPEQIWLLGAGISHSANIPLMHPLTSRVLKLCEDSAHITLVKALREELPNDSHIEHLLSHLGDYAAIADRISPNKVTIRGEEYSKEDLEKVHSEILNHIADIVRWGYRPADKQNLEKTGTYDKPLVSINEHTNFLKTLFGKRQSGLDDRRSPIRFFTTNYDTLLEDALALCSIPYWDGFSGGAVAFRNYRFGDSEPEKGFRAHVIKLHGSIDWHLSNDNKVLRVRDHDLYPEKTSRVLIYPQATKYVATQRDPFATQFDIFRRTLLNGRDNILAICGYSFGDEHINQEIEFALANSNSKTTVLAFCQAADNLPEILDTWRHSLFGKRIYILTEKGLYVGTKGPLNAPTAENKLNWWTFEGVTKLLENGVEGAIE